jgi:hypothetical protein
VNWFKSFKSFKTFQSFNPASAVGIDRKREAQSFRSEVDGF